MVGQPALREVVGADALAAIARADLQPARFGLRRGLFGPLLVEQARLQQRHRARAILVLAALVLALDDDAGRQVRDADRRVGLVDVLAAGAGSAERIDLEVGRIQVDVLDLVHLGQDGDRCGRGMDSALRLGLGHALHAMRAGLELQFREYALAFDARDDFLEAAVFAVVADMISTRQPWRSA